MPRYTFRFLPRTLVLVLLVSSGLGCDSSSDEAGDESLRITRVDLALMPAGSTTPVTAVYDLATGTVDTLLLFPSQEVDVTVTLLDAGADPADTPTQAIKQDPDRFQLIYTPTSGLESRLRVDYRDRDADYNLDQEGNNLPVGLAVVLYVSDDQATGEGGLRIRLSRYEGGEKTAGVPSVDNDLDIIWPVRILFL
jgi:hypothetical protein